MKNSASNEGIIQALQPQSAQIMTVLTALFSKLPYHKITHQRISQLGNDSGIIYQGLVRAAHQQLGQVMIKWQISPSTHRYSTDLAQEIKVLNTLRHLSINHPEAIVCTIVPPILYSEHLHFDDLKKSLFNQPHHLSFFVMPYYPNGSLAHYLKQPINDQQKHERIRQVAQLLAALHNMGWIHGDIKPSNILVNGDACISNHQPVVLLLTDFALAKPLDNNSLLSISHLTYSAGTPAYLAPECWQGQGASVQSDGYAFGIMMYEILMDKRPFTIHARSAEPLTDWAIQHCQQAIAVLPNCYNHYQKILEKALAKRVAHRYRNMQEILRDFEALGD